MQILLAPETYRCLYRDQSEGIGETMYSRDDTNCLQSQAWYQPSHVVMNMWGGQCQFVHMKKCHCSNPRNPLILVATTSKLNWCVLFFHRHRLSETALIWSELIMHIYYSSHVFKYFSWLLSIPSRSRSRVVKPLMWTGWMFQLG